MKLTPAGWAFRVSALIALDHAYRVRIKGVVNADRISLILKTRALIMHDRVIDMGYGRK